MLPKKYRLRKQKEIEKVAKLGKKKFNKGLGIKYLKNNLDHSRFCIVVSKKVHKKVFKRNKLKRQLREIIRLNLDKIKPGYDIMILTKKETLDLDFQKLKLNLLNLLKKI